MIIDKSFVDNLTTEYLRPNGNALFEEMQYSTFGGGRLRPLLFLQTVDAFGHKIDGNAERLAVALELVHSYSLVHDDLPCMDNDTYRRGKLTCHAKFGETRAVLCGDALLNLAFETFCGGFATANNGYLLAGKAIFDASSAYEGMIAGQADDLFGKNSSLQEIVKTDLQKTGALISVAFQSAALYVGADSKTVDVCRQLGQELGLAYQFYDDICDEGEKGNSILNVLTKQQAVALCREKCEHVHTLVKLLPCSSIPFLFELLAKIETKIAECCKE